jgi:predicted metal-dependent hydrolase
VEAQNIIAFRLPIIETKYNILGIKLNFKHMSIRSQRTRWGSASSRGNLSFNYRIIYLPPELQDLIIAHELCHLREMNHSPAFWALVEKAVPDYKRLRRELRRYRF